MIPNQQRVEGLSILYIMLIVIMQTLYGSTLPITLSNVGLVNINSHLYLYFILFAYTPGVRNRLVATSTTI